MLRVRDRSYAASAIPPRSSTSPPGLTVRAIAQLVNDFRQLGRRDDLLHHQPDHRTTVISNGLQEKVIRAFEPSAAALFRHGDLAAVFSIFRSVEHVIGSPKTAAFVFAGLVRLSRFSSIGRSILAIVAFLTSTAIVNSTERNACWNGDHLGTMSGRAGQHFSADPQLVTSFR